MNNDYMHENSDFGSHAESSICLWKPENVWKYKRRLAQEPKNTTKEIIFYKKNYLVELKSWHFPLSCIATYRRSLFNMLSSLIIPIPHLAFNNAPWNSILNLGVKILC